MARTQGAISRNREIKADKLREVLKPIYEKLQKRGVEESDLPSPEHVINSFLKKANTEVMNEWVEEYSSWVKQKP